jgi:NADP-dependent 3-hydroxy acid dehydrogenase YdfG
VLVKDRKVAFISGAASGIGRATAEFFSARGWWIAAADRNSEGLEKLCDTLGRDHCRSWPLDTRDKAAYDVVISELAEESDGRLDLLFNNAGIAAVGFFEEIPIEESLKIIDVNLIGVINGIYAALPLLKATPGSLCFSTSSSAATFGAPNLAIYTATKFAVKGLTEALAVELSRCDVRVADVLPGVIDTAIFGDSPVFVKGERISLGEGSSAIIPAAEEGPFRMISPDQVAEAVWNCYQGEPRMHWYVPDEIEEIEKAKAASPEKLRDERIAARKENA